MTGDECLKRYAGGLFMELFGVSIVGRRFVLLYLIRYR